MANLLTAARKTAQGQRGRTSTEDVDIEGVIRPTFLAGRLPTIKRSISARLGELVSATSMDGPTARSYLLKVKCVREHVFTVSSKDLLRGCWCPPCAEAAKRQLLVAALARMGKHAKRLGGKCLAPAYESARAPVAWSCAKGHQWAASWDNVRNKKSWCPTCARAASRFR